MSYTPTTGITTDIPIIVNEKIICLWFFDMIHDFCDSYDLSKDFELDLTFLLKIYEKTFGELSGFTHVKVHEIIGHLKDKKVGLLPSNFMEAAETMAYSFSTEEHRYFWSQSRDTTSKKASILKNNTLEEVDENSGMMTSNDDIAVLQAGTYYGHTNVDVDVYGNFDYMFTDKTGNTINVEPTNPIYVIEDATKSAKQITKLYENNIETVLRFLPSTPIVSLSTLPGFYDEANDTLIKTEPDKVSVVDFNLTYDTILSLKKTINFPFYTNPSTVLFTAIMNNEKINRTQQNQVTSNIYTLSISIISGCFKNNMDLLIKKITASFDWLKAYWKVPFSGLMFYRYLMKPEQDALLFLTNTKKFLDKVSLIEDKNLNRMSVRDVLTNYSTELTLIDSDMNMIGTQIQQFGMTPIGDVFESINHVYYGETKYTVASPKPSPINISIVQIMTNIIKDSKTKESIYYDFKISTEVEQPYDATIHPKILKSGKTINSFLLQIYDTFIKGLPNTESKIECENHLKELKPISCGPNTCNYIDVLTGSTNGQLPTNSNEKKKFGVFSRSITEILITNIFKNDKYKDMLDFLIIIFNLYFFGQNINTTVSPNVIQSNDSLNSLLTTIESDIHTYFLDADPVRSQINLELKYGDIETAKKQEPSVVNIASDFRNELVTIYQMGMGNPKTKQKTAVNILAISNEKKGARNEGISEEMATEVQKIIHAILNVETTIPNVLFIKLFLILFQKTFCDFSQIVITNYLSKNPITACTVFNNGHSIISHPIWFISFDKMATLIALYYGTNVIRQGVSEGLIGNKGYVSYGFSNWNLLEEISKKTNHDNVYLDDILALKNQYYNPTVYSSTPYGSIAGYGYIPIVPPNSSLPPPPPPILTRIPTGGNIRKTKRRNTKRRNTKRRNMKKRV